MSVYGITGVHLDEHGRVLQATMRQVDVSNKSWVGEPRVFAANDVASRIVIGDEVYSIFIIDRGQTVHGPKFRQVVYPGGSEGIELEDDIEGRRVQDLVLF